MPYMEDYKTIAGFKYNGPVQVAIIRVGYGDGTEDEYTWAIRIGDGEIAKHHGRRFKTPMRAEESALTHIRLKKEFS